MKHLLERFLCMTTPDVLDTFAALPGAQVNKSFIFIPGTRDRRLLLVAHADTVFDAPPRCIDWYGNFAKAGTGPSRTISGPFITGRKKAPEPEAAPIEVVPEPVVVEPPKPEVLTKDKKREFIMEKSIGYVMIDGEKLTIPEFRERVEKDRDKELITKASAPKSTPKVTNHTSGYGNHSGNVNTRWSNQGRGIGLGADDRAGITAMWLLRKSGHSILITDGEESGGIGAKAASRMIPEQLSEHLFAVEIDRQMDQEMVFYDVSTKDFEAYMQQQTGYRIDRGSYTDIKDVCNAAGICGVNLAAGYWNQHQTSETLSYDAWLRTYNQVRRLCNMEHEQFLLKKTVPAASPAPTVHNVPVTVQHGSRGSYKGGSRFPDATAHRTDSVTQEKTGVAMTTTRIDPITRERTVQRQLIGAPSDSQALSFPNKSAASDQAIEDVCRAAFHAGILPQNEHGETVDLAKIGDVSLN